MSEMVKRTCGWRKCRATFEARPADVKRGWGRYCSKSCKAMEQESRTGQNAAFFDRVEKSDGQRDDDEHLAAVEDGWDGHKNWH